MDFNRPLTAEDRLLLEQFAEQQLRQRERARFMDDRAFQGELYMRITIALAVCEYGPEAIRVLTPAPFPQRDSFELIAFKAKVNMFYASVWDLINMRFGREFEVARMEERKP